MEFNPLDEESLGHCRGILDGKYKIFATVGRGQFAKVKLGQATDSLEWYAIKMMKEHQVNSQEKLSYFMNEVRLLSQCCLPSIVEIISVSISGIYSKASGGKKPAVYYVMRYAKYGDIFRHVRETGRFPEVLARTFFVQLIQGLEFLHSIGIAHRDIKPENLLLDDSMNIALADFGSAAKCRTAANKVVEFDSAVIVGSQEYNAPEINMDKFYRGDKADIFSAAICLFVMVVGNIPFRLASCSDPYFQLLSQKDKSAYWSIYGSVPITTEFKDFFEKLTNQNVDDRLDIAQVKEHPWIKGKIYTHPELVEAMKERIQLYSKITRAEYEEKVEKAKHTIKKPPLPLIDMPLLYKFSDPFIQSCLAECVEINSHLNKQRECKLSEAKKDSSSDDQINSNSDDNNEDLDELSLETEKAHLQARK
eukprot:TRINITY_DN18848_c0_g1_i2.p1 TRINITY_DN18848_c0_g1~~TRINITY_DN18848_c0_g1_i2.p1  ORF type:complete len:421 (+),score=57.94 TRINITY_DN18848_c0_g1_i2:49-1311(+)